MTDQLPVTLDDLKRAIAEYERFQYPHNLADAWRTAFDWLKGWNIRSGNPRATAAVLLLEYTEGMAMIEEKLR